MSTVRRRDKGIVVTLSPEERQLLASLVGATVTLLDDDETAGTTSSDPLAAMVGLAGGPVETPDDPVLKRLLPDAYADPEQATEFRRLMDGDLRARKSEALRQVLADLAGAETIVLDPDDGVGAWLQALNDVRLALGTRLDVTEDWTETFEALPPDDPRLPLYLFYDWLSMLQDALVTAVMGRG